MKKREILEKHVRNTDITVFDSTSILEGFHNNSGGFEDLRKSTDIYKKMLKDKSCNIILSISSGSDTKGCLKIYADMMKYNLIDAIIISGSNIIDLDFFEALGFNYYHRNVNISDEKLRTFYINYQDNYLVDEDDLIVIDETIKEIADQLPPRNYSSRELMEELGKFLQLYASKRDSIIQTAYEHSVPVFCLDLAASRAGYGILKHYSENPNHHITVDIIKDLKELGQLNSSSPSQGNCSIKEKICKGSR
jgi:deoxyhypusine synthase